MKYCKWVGAVVIGMTLAFVGGCHHDDVIEEQEPAAVAPATYSNEDWAAVLAMVVTPDGYVRWDMLQNNQDGVRHKLAQYMGQLAQVSPVNHPELFKTEEDKRAYWINAYNAMCMYWVVRYQYPADVPANMPEQFTVGGQQLAPNDILFWLRQHGQDPSVFFGLNFCAHSCPPLRNVPYDGPILAAQLQDQAHVYLNDPRAVTREGDVVYLNHYLYDHILDFAKGVGREDPKYWEAYTSFAADDSPLIGGAEAKDGGFDWSLNRPPR